MLGAGASGGRATGRPLLNEVDGLGAAGAAARAAGFAAAFRGAAFGALRLAVARFAVVRFAVDFLPPARFAVDRLAVDFFDDFFFAGISPPFGYAMFHRACWFVRMRTAAVTCEL